MTWPLAMVDLEGMGPSPGGAILRVGIVPFSLEPGDERVAPRETWLDVGLAVERNAVDGRTFDRPTVDWWDQQSDVARTALRVQPMAVSVKHLASIVSTYFGSPLFGPRLALWAKPPTYDLAMLKHLFQQAGERWPIHWRDERDLRTLLDVCDGLGIPGAHEHDRGVAHSAVDDAAWQALQAVTKMRGLRVLATKDRGPGTLSAQPPEVALPAITHSDVVDAATVQPG